MRFWRSGDSVNAGRVAYDSMPADARPGWATEILKWMIVTAAIESELFSDVLRAGNDARHWGDGHKIFRSLRRATLSINSGARQRSQSEDEKIFALIVDTAELVAKVIYNATNPVDEFDEDCGWYIAQNVKFFIDHGYGDERHQAKAVSLLTLGFP